VSAGFNTILSIAGPLAADTLPPLPNYADDLAGFESQRAGAGGPGISNADKAVIQKATKDLAAAMPEPGLKVGGKAPDFALPNARGTPVSLYEQLQQGPVVLSFYRGAWCPYCNLQLRGLKVSLPHFERHDARLIAVTPQTPDKSLEQVEKDG
jgi:hypothetical protein